MPAPFASLFFYGSLLDIDVLALVVERDVAAADLRAARIDDYQRVRLLHDTYPMLVPAPGQCVHGAVFDLRSERELERIRFFEADEYQFETCRVQLPDGAWHEALFCAEAAMPGGALGEWHLAEWQRRHKARYLRQARRYMSAFGLMSPAQADSLWTAADSSPEAVSRRAGHRG
ncbi:MAG: gamma-glutamylcyclotransferase [Planctomycetes bacterium]|nr:gamma-glutamylcyclotransferase [Planctomycetota bacterium]